MLHKNKFYLFVYSLDVVAEFGQSVGDLAGVQLAQYAVISRQPACGLQHGQPQPLRGKTAQNGCDNNRKLPKSTEKYRRLSNNYAYYRV